MSIKLPDHLSSSEKKILTAFFHLLGTNDPSLDQIWRCMDFVWDTLGCNNKSIENTKLTKFYSHPIWLLNGLFIEQHEESLLNRDTFTAWVVSQSPKRIADFGGGFGTLARKIAEQCPDTIVEVIEPHPHQLALEWSSNYPNLRYQTQLEGEYDLLLATDVFEHIPDPLYEIEKTSKYLRTGGKYLIANCFFPVIKCHLPCTFHFRYSWAYLLARMNLIEYDQVAYGKVFKKIGNVSASKVRFEEHASQKLFPIFEYISSRRRKVRRWRHSMLNRARLYFSRF
jgi:2-polyprenyl-3-methyl-5-hydroxy-6-metoxy-1,4-benzoquinol methylase